MAVTAYLYSKGKELIHEAAMNLSSDTIKVALCTSSYTPAQTTHDYFDDITNEVAGTGYTAGGATLASVTSTVSGVVYTFDAADVTWSSSTITARYAIIYDSTPGSAATNPLIGYVDFGEDKVSSSGNFVITWNASGIFTDTVAAA